MRPARTFRVTPCLPSALAPLRELAQDLHWCWDHDAINLFRRLDADLWESAGHNPVRLLGIVQQSRLDELEADPSFRAHLQRVVAAREAYHASTDGSWFARTHGVTSSPLVAYFSAEFGLTDCMSIFAGGLGLLAGDHLKSASDLGVPLVGVGLLYQEGYFRQYLNDSGWQQEAYEDNDFYNLPLELILSSDGRPLFVEVPLPGRSARVQIWRARVGRVDLYLLDTNVRGNTTEDGDITDQLYGGDAEMRIRQEIVLGIGGYRALEALGIQPAVYHMNEGHSAFLGLERIRRLMEGNDLGFAEAREAASAGLVFTSHTPVAAGHDYFSAALMDRYFADYPARLGLSREQFLALGRSDPTSAAEPFCMTVLALHLAAHSNGVSLLHRRVTRRMWQGIWPSVPESELPIGDVTNGVHLPSWLSQEMSQLYGRYLGANWAANSSERATWDAIEQVPNEEIWRVHEARRERLVNFARRRLRAQAERRGAPQAEVEASSETLDHGVLTIGFARRFATYKRATLLFRDPERLARIMSDPHRPVQFVFAGKAHPRDEAGKELIRQIVNLSRREPFRRRLVFIEDFDMTVSRYLVQGADVWLNTPLRPYEASGTSGMKAAANGVLNLSIPDGWWDEAWNSANPKAPPIGWSIGHGESYVDPEHQADVEAEALYDLLERDVVPRFYDRQSSGIPKGWVESMKASIGGLCHFFNTDRMVREYTDRFYAPAAETVASFTADRMRRARELAAWKERVRGGWTQVRVGVLSSGESAEYRIGEPVRARASVTLGSLAPDDVRVELCIGPLDSDGRIIDPTIVTMAPTAFDGDSRYTYEAEAQTDTSSGRHGYTVRVRPEHPDLNAAFIPGLIAWPDQADW